MPAGLITACRPLNVSIACSIMWATPLRLVTLSEFDTALPPAATISRATISAGPAEPSSPPATAPPRSLTTTLAPSFAANSAHSLPMPLAPPVTRTTLPASTPMWFLRARLSSLETSEPTLSDASEWTIRSERPEDALLVDTLNEAAFGPGRFAKSAYRLREGVSHLGELSFVAIEGRKFRGSVRFWPIAIGGHPALMLGPLAVQADQRGRGIGISLMEHALAEARRLGHEVVILIGDEPYYARVGFAKLPPGRIRFPGPVDPS